MKTWRIDDSRDLYNIRGWGINYFDINEEGHATVCPLRTKGPSIDLFKLVQELDLLDMPAPILLRFPDILDMRIEKITSASTSRFRNTDSKARFTMCFPSR